MTLDSESIALAAGSILVAEHILAVTKNPGRQAKMERVIERKAIELGGHTDSALAAKSVFVSHTADWDAPKRRKLIVDLAFADPFAPYSLRYPKRSVIEALEPIVEDLGEPSSLLVEIVAVRKQAMLSHHSRSLARVGALTLMSGAIVATAGWALAPAVGASIGASAGLAGAAATAHGLSLLGGGSLAAGGAGMAGGMWMVAGMGGVTGASIGGATSIAYQLGASEMRSEIVKLQVTFRIAVLRTQADLAGAAEVIDGLQVTLKDLEVLLAAERELNDENAARVTDLEKKVALLAEAVEWMENESSEVRNEPVSTN